MPLSSRIYKRVAGLGWCPCTWRAGKAGKC